MKIKTTKIQHILKTKGMTLDGLAKKMGLGSRQAADYRIRHARSLRTILSLAKALGVKFEDII